MPARKTPEEVLLEAVELYRRHGSFAAAERASGLDRTTLRSRYKTAALHGLVKPIEIGTPGFRVTRTTHTVDDDGTERLRSVEQKRAPGERFKVPKGHAVKGVSTLVDPDGNTIVEWVKTRESDQRREIMLEAVREALAEARGKAEIATPAGVLPDDLLTVYVLPDLHLGMRADDPEPYDLDTARRTLREAVATLVGSCPASQRAAVLFLGDIFHNNDSRNATPRSGHVLDVDGKWRSIYGTGARLARDLISDVAGRHAEVEVVILPGNHDEDAAITLGVAFELYYEAHPRIRVAGVPGEHWFARFGAVLLGANHGHRMRPDRMAMMLATDRPADWGETRHRHFFFGHVHHESKREIGAVRVESFNSPAPKDAHARDAGWRSGRALNAVTFHRERGEIARHRVSL